VNTVGAVLGSLSAVWLLLPSLGLSSSAWLLGAVMLLLAMRLAGPRGRVIAVLAGAAGLVLAVTGSSRLGYERVHGYASLVGHRLLAYREGPEATVAVVEAPGGVRNLLIDGFTATSDGAPGSEYMEWMGRLPMLLHPAPRDALVICFGTGRTANAVLEEQPERVDVVDVNPDVFDLAKHFPSNRGVLEDPRVHRVAMDGRAWLRRADRRYDAVTLEPMPPHFAGVNALYSVEFYRIVARRLQPRGVAAQWLPLHLLPPYHAASVAATFRSVFPNAALWMGPGTSSGILLGSLAPLSEPIGQRWPGFDRELERAFSPRGVERFRILGPAELERYAALGELITDDNQLLAYDLVRSQQATFGPPRMAYANLRLIRRIARGLDARLPQPDEAATAAPRRRP
jgi:spermidine synthase